MSKRILWGIVGLAVVASQLAPGREAVAIPSFARQSGTDCAACHTVFPELTSFGRSFKLRGYTMTSRTEDESSPRLQEDTFAPLSAMMLVSFTSTGREQPDSQNGNLLLPDQLSLFYAGRISGHAGAFVQLTYSGIDDHISMDNTDLRLAAQKTIGDGSLVYGLTGNNNPTVQDVWNSVPAWGFPFASSGIAPGPAAAAQVDGTLAQQVAGLGAYAYWNSTLYGELSFYRSSPIGGKEPPTSEDTNVIQGTAPYWRLAATHGWGPHTVEIGTYGMVVDAYPGGGRPLEGAVNRFTDTAFDAQYQYIAAAHTASLGATWIREKQEWHASFPAGAANPTDTLSTSKVSASYYFKRRIGGSVGYFSTTGDSDPLLYPAEPVSGSASGKPDSAGWICELDYLPWLNTKFSAQYIRYNKFNGSSSNYDGSGRDASANNTIYLSVWLMY